MSRQCMSHSGPVVNSTKDMKILFASSSFFGGGITSYAHEFINCFAAKHEVCVMLGDDSRLPITNPKVKVYYHSMYTMTENNLLTVLHTINDEIKPDVVINSHAAVISVLAPYLNDNIRLITVSHSLKYMEAELAGINNKYVDKIVALSHYGKQYLERRFGIKDDSKIDVIYNFVHEHPQAQAIKDSKTANPRIKIVFPGGCAPSKTPELALQVVRQLIKTDLDFDLYWLGGDVIHLSRYFKFLGLGHIQKLIKEDPRLHITGRIPRKDAEEMCATANVFFFPSRREGCPMSLIEAMRVGAICIVSDFNNANKEIIEDGKNGYVIAHDDINAFVDRFKDIIAHHDRYKHLYDSSHERYHQLLSPAVWEEKMSNAVEQGTLSHMHRKGVPGKLALRAAIIKHKLTGMVCRAWVTVEEDIATLLAFYRLKNKE